ncbi:hypothetical protein GF359_09250 [candidate division WOR-3 bacterium]|uniref:Glyoxalase-like domain-containing protein n=1 Tax=candidate division WOR-3 bacterium TaxID=2052148 RepID=A0A9D5QEV3_UNCW3|nr:hypothetical protein [candidate division WOR-3 bacterium]MBD3365385.1 hypothetical protein [candidate division WOR-3 bacterium]
MLRLNHLIVHIDNDEEILTGLKKELYPQGYPFNPESGEKGGGYQASNIWIGKQYIQLVRLTREAGTGWEERWVKAYNEGHRGPVALIIATHRLDELREGFEKQDLDIQIPKKASSKDIIGLFTDLLGITKQAPWKILYLPSIPGTDMEIGFIEYQGNAEEELAEIMKPNSANNGITSINRAKIYLPQWEEGMEYLGKIFPDLKDSKSQYRIRMLDSELLFFRSEPGEFGVKLETSCEKKDLVGGKFDIENLSVKTTG